MSGRPASPDGFPKDGVVSGSDLLSMGRCGNSNHELGVGIGRIPRVIPRHVPLLARICYV